MGSASSRPQQSPSNSETTSKSGIEKGDSSSSATLVLPSGHHAADRLHRIHAEASAGMSASTNRHRAVTSAARSPPLSEVNDSLERSSGRSYASVDLEAVRAWDSDALTKPTSQLAAMTLHNGPINTSLRSRTSETTSQHIYSHTLKRSGTPVTNQRSSGRCWLFATTNVVRLEVIDKLNLKDFELSQSYLSFWDKLEKSNTFLENSIELADAPLDDRVFGFLKTAPTNDGGQWDMVCNLIEKYGLVPKSIYPESYNSSNSSKVNWIITLKLREFALELRQLKQATMTSLSRAGGLTREQMQACTVKALRMRKDVQMQDVYRIMAISLGVPPMPHDEFTFDYYDADGKFKSLKSTPVKFAKEQTGSFTTQGACSLVNDPRRAYNKLISIDRLQNVWGGRPVLYVNTSTSQMKESVVASIKAGIPVFFGCDVGQFSETASGIMDTDLFGYELAYGIKLGLTKAERIELGESSMTHAMVITGVHLDDKGSPVRYRVENSWGAENVGKDGYMCMTDAWFDEFVYQVVIRKEHMPSRLWSIFQKGIDEETDVLPPYDPMGSLASSMAIDSAPQDQANAVEESSEDLPEDEYEIEAILSHETGHFEQGEMAYLVSWKGYGPEHNSWVRAEDAENAKEMLKDYWKNAPRLKTVTKSVGGTKNGKGAKASQSASSRVKKERSSSQTLSQSRRSSARATPTATEMSLQQRQASSKREKTALKAMHTIPGVNSMSPAEEDDGDESEELTEAQLKRLGAEEANRRRKRMEMKRYHRLGDWEQVVKQIETVEKDENGKLLVFCLFENGSRQIYEASVVHYRCPQKLLHFYESRLRFRPKPKADEPVANTTAEPAEAPATATSAEEATDSAGTAAQDKEAEAKEQQEGDEEDAALAEQQEEAEARSAAGSAHGAEEVQEAEAEADKDDEPMKDGEEAAADASANVDSSAHEEQQQEEATMEKDDDESPLFRS